MWTRRKRGSILQALILGRVLNSKSFLQTDRRRLAFADMINCKRAGLPDGFFLASSSFDS
jgi:hypothetical protein